MVFSCILKLSALCLLTGLLVGLNEPLLLWAFVPIATWISMNSYHSYLSKSFNVLLLDSQVDYVWVIRGVFIILSFGFQLVQAMLLTALFNLGWLHLLVCWWVLDITAFLTYCVDLLSRQSSGSLVSQLMLFPLVCPWTLCGAIAVQGSISAIKFVAAAWLCIHAIGSYLYYFCIRIGD